jgi:hypothetical protein
MTISKTVGRGDQTTGRVQVRVLALLENPQRVRVRVLSLLENPRLDRVRALALLENLRQDRGVDRWFEAPVKIICKTKKQKNNKIDTNKVNGVYTGQ